MKDPSLVKEAKFDRFATTNRTFSKVEQPVRDARTTTTTIEVNNVYGTSGGKGNEKSRAEVMRTTYGTRLSSEEDIARLKEAYKRE